MTIAEESVLVIDASLLLAGVVGSDPVTVTPDEAAGEVLADAVSDALWVGTLSDAETYWGLSWDFTLVDFDLQADVDVGGCGGGSGGGNGGDGDADTDTDADREGDGGCDSGGGCDGGASCAGGGGGSGCGGGGGGGGSSAICGTVGFLSPMLLFGWALRRRPPRRRTITNPVAG